MTRALSQPPGVSDFGEASDFLVISGTINIAGEAEFAEFDLLRSLGSIIMVDILTANSLLIAGAFADLGGQIAIDVDLPIGTSDILSIA